MPRVKLYKIFTNLSKAISLLGIVVILFWFYIYTKPNDVEYHSTESQALIPLSTNNTENYGLTIVKSVFDGMNKGHEPYKIKADTAVKIAEEIYKLENIEAVYLLNNGTLSIKSSQGVLNDTSKLIRLTEKVNMLYQGYLLNTQQLELDLATKKAESNSVVDINYKNSQITANGFEANDKNNIVHFYGNVHTIINPDDF